MSSLLDLPGGYQTYLLRRLIPSVSLAQTQVKIKSKSNPPYQNQTKIQWVQINSPGSCVTESWCISKPTAFVQLAIRETLKRRVTFLLLPPEEFLRGQLLSPVFLLGRQRLADYPGLLACSVHCSGRLWGPSLCGGR